MMLRKLLAGAGLALCLAAPALAGPPVVLKGEVLAQGPVTLGDLFEGAGGAARVVVAPAPAPGGSVMIDAAVLQRVAAANGLSWINDKGLRRVIIRGGAPAPAIQPAAGRPVAGGATVAPAAARSVEVLTWTRSLTAGEEILAEDLAWTPMASAPAGAARDADALIGKIAKRPLRVGSAAALRDVGSPKVIAKDDIVSVVYNAPGVTLTLQGKAMGPAAAGEPFAVTNLQSKKVFQAVATGPGQAVVGPQAEALRTPQSLALR